MAGVTPCRCATCPPSSPATRPSRGHGGTLKRCTGGGQAHALSDTGVRATCAASPPPTTAPPGHPGRCATNPGGCAAIPGPVRELRSPVQAWPASLRAAVPPALRPPLRRDPREGMGAPSKGVRAAGRRTRYPTLAYGRRAPRPLHQLRHRPAIPGAVRPIQGQRGHAQCCAAIPTTIRRDARRCADEPVTRRHSAPPTPVLLPADEPSN
jgi:hypothetical protein